MRIGLKPVETLSLVFISALSLLTVAFLKSIPFWYWLEFRFGLLVLAILASASAAPASSRQWLFMVRSFLPVLIIPVIFDSLGDLIPWIRPCLFDRQLINIDYALFGVHPTVWLERFILPWLTTTLQFAYISYYPMAVVLGVTLAAMRKQKEFDEAIFGIALCFFLSYIGYIAVPAIGPRFTLTDLQTIGLEAGPLVISIQETLNKLENTKMDAFPSGHTAIALMTVYYAWKAKVKVLAGILLPVVLALIISTVYLRYHYAIDVLAGIGLSIVTIGIAPRLFGLLSRYSADAND